jgi:hypothetical protein
MHDPDDPIPPLPEDAADGHLEAAYDDRFELGED